MFSNGAAPILFIDEIHRFNKAQQDALLGAVENGTIVLIGATTENPSFEVITPLLSRCQVFVLKSLEVNDLQMLLDRALKNDVLLKEKNIEVKETEALFRYSGGDGRKLLNVLEIVIDSFAGKESHIVIDNETVTGCIQENLAIYDKDGEMHYDIISAFIKSMRGSDPDAAVYWLARMIDGGEDPKFIARRMYIAASEDIGNADPQALLVAEAAFRAAEVIGYPECRINLAQAAIYLALAPKSNSAEAAIDAALREVRNGPVRKVPDYLRDRHRPGSENYGEYKYPHSYPAGWVDQRYLPEGLERGCFYQPGERGWEAYRTDAAARDRQGS